MEHDPSRGSARDATARVLGRLEGIKAVLVDASIDDSRVLEIDAHIAAIESALAGEDATGSTLDAVQRMVPHYEVDERDDDHVAGRVTFGSFYAGSGLDSVEVGSVHGGAIALLFDEVLGWISLRGGKTRTRTAYLKVDFRSGALVGEPLQFTGWTDVVEGRKQVIRGRLMNGSTVVADIESLYVTPREWAD
jgi:acyl-coenzyme A thioesterase PaaI-like protein